MTTTESKANISDTVGIKVILLSWGRKLELTVIPEAFVMIAYLLLQINGLLNQGYIGQDYSTHMSWIRDAQTKPFQFAFHFSANRTNPPLYHLMAALAGSYGPFHSFEMNVGIFNLITGFVGILLFVATARIFINSVTLRLAFALLIAFLPVFVIHNLVTASDVLTLPMVGMVLFGFAKFLGPAPTRNPKAGIAWITTGLIGAILTKFTFIATPFVIMAFIGAMSRLGFVTRRQSFYGLMIAGAIPMIVSCILWLRFHHTTDNYALEKRPRIGDGFTPSLLLIVQARDTDMLDAPPYAQRTDLQTGAVEEAPFDACDPWPGDGKKFRILADKVYSYQPLLINAIFTDVMNFRQFRQPWQHKHFGPRSVTNQRRMRTAIRFGIIIYVAVMIGSLSAFFITARGFLRKRNKKDLFILTTFLLGGAIAAPVVVGLLFVPGAYYGGYWLPRLILPSIACVLLALFVWLERLNSRFGDRFIGVPLLLFVLSQSALYFSYLWI